MISTTPLGCQMTRLRAGQNRIEVPRFSGRIQRLRLVKASRINVSAGTISAIRVSSWERQPKSRAMVTENSPHAC